ncbi:hypothetical protein HMPREF1229_0526 [Streptococcus pyogenes GA40634]|nr:hypothetical protein HMPREF1229_0526 [Streptococcus pyogenes GA40634]EQL77786.1 hypothetical protein HMPREF1225_0709 [Streptococcus pyogenes UTSW-2]ESA51314.1 hypothetical protein HMPREF1236_1350 [Streptococcus pyogenes GA40056]
MTRKEELNTIQLAFTSNSKRKQINKRLLEDLVNLPIIINNYYQFRLFNKIRLQKTEGGK